jgi:hypothetical protein
MATSAKDTEDTKPKTQKILTQSRKAAKRGVTGCFVVKFHRQSCTRLRENRNYSEYYLRETRSLVTDVCVFTA